MYDFNLLVSSGPGGFFLVKSEIEVLLKELGDDKPVIKKTIARNIIGVKTKLNSRKVIKGIRKIFEKNPLAINLAIKWVPVDNWCKTDVIEMKKIIAKLKKEIKPGEKWALDLEKRRWELMHKIDIIKELAKNIKEEVDLENPDKILRVDIIGDNTGISILKPEEIFSIAKV